MSSVTRLAGPSGQTLELNVNVMGRHMHRHGHSMATSVAAVFVLYFLLKTQGAKLRNDWTPVGIGVKMVLVVTVVGLIYYPYELFMKGPEAVQRAMHTPG